MVAPTKPAICKLISSTHRVSSDDKAGLPPKSIATSTALPSVLAVCAHFRAEPEGDEKGVALRMCCSAAARPPAGIPVAAVTSRHAAGSSSLPSLHYSLPPHLPPSRPSLRRYLGLDHTDKMSAVEIIGGVRAGYPAMDPFAIIANLLDEKLHPTMSSSYLPGLQALHAVYAM